MRASRLGVWVSRLGVRASRLGVWASRLGVSASRLGVWVSRLGVWASRLGVWVSRLGVWASRLGVWASRLGVWASKPPDSEIIKVYPRNFRIHEVSPCLLFHCKTGFACDHGPIEVFLVQSRSLPDPKHHLSSTVRPQAIERANNKESTILASHSSSKDRPRTAPK